MIKTLRQQPEVQFVSWEKQPRSRVLPKPGYRRKQRCPRKSEKVPAGTDLELVFAGLSVLDHLLERVGITFAKNAGGSDTDYQEAFRKAVEVADKIVC